MTPRRGLDLDTIVSRAAAMADASGAEEVTLASLASELGVRSPSLYNHVKGLSELKELMTTLGLKRLNERLSNIGKGITPEAELMDLADAFLSFAAEHPGLYELTLKSPGSEEGDPLGERKEQRDLASQLVSRLLGVIRELGLKEEEGIHAVRGLRSLLHGFASIGQKGGFGMPVDLKTSIRFVLKSYIRGLVVAVNESGSAD
ncbi:TetR-like C-terminal domain-containing protein [Paenibacillus sp. strain BS8-2]